MALRIETLLTSAQYAGRHLRRAKILRAGWLSKPGLICSDEIEISRVRQFGLVADHSSAVSLEPEKTPSGKVSELRMSLMG
jgi:hypothetical protein